MVFGYNLTFYLQHFQGLMGMPLRTYTYGAHPGWFALNALSTLGAFFMAAGVLVFLWNAIKALRFGPSAGDNPWDAFTLEWTTTSPPPEGNFAELPPIRSRRPVLDLNHPDLADLKVQRTPEDLRKQPRSAARIASACFVASGAMFFLLLVSAYI